MPISNVTTFDAQVARPYTNQTMIARLSAFFGLVAVFLSCIGLYGLSASDPQSLVIACVVLGVAGVIAGYLPARRASRVDPVVALRCE